MRQVLYSSFILSIPNSKLKIFISSSLSSKSTSILFWLFPGKDEDDVRDWMDAIEEAREVTKDIINHTEKLLNQQQTIVQNPLVAPPMKKKIYRSKSEEFKRYLLVFLS